MLKPITLECQNHPKDTLLVKSGNDGGSTLVFWDADEETHYSFMLSPADAGRLARFLLKEVVKPPRKSPGWSAPRTGGYSGGSTREELKANPPIPPKTGTAVRRPRWKDYPR